MVRMTIIARLDDGLILCSSEDEILNDPVARESKSLFKQLIKNIHSNTLSRFSIESDQFNIFHILIARSVIYAVLCTTDFNRNDAFKYLDELEQIFDKINGSQVASATMVNAFSSFDAVIFNTKRKYQSFSGSDTQDIYKLNSELHDVRRIMTQSIRDVMDRGVRIEQVSSMARNLSDSSRHYLKDAKYANLQEIYRRYGPIVIISITVLSLLYIRFRFF